MSSWLLEENVERENEHRYKKEEVRGRAPLFFLGSFLGYWKETSAPAAWTGSLTQGPLVSPCRWRGGGSTCCGWECKGLPTSTTVLLINQDPWEIELAPRHPSISMSWWRTERAGAVLTEGEQRTKVWKTDWWWQGAWLLLPLCISGRVYTTPAALTSVCPSTFTLRLGG